MGLLSALLAPVKWIAKKYLHILLVVGAAYWLVLR